jgi:hypothetical protein
MDMKTQKMLADIIVNAKKDEVKPYTTKATVRSVNGTTIYVDIPGSDNSTPVKASSVAVKVGDVVDIYVSHNDTHITGNRSDVAVSRSTTDKMSKDAEQSKLEMYNDLEIIGNKMRIMNNDITMQGNQIDIQNTTITQMNDTIYSQGNVITQQGNKITEIDNTVNSQNNTITQQGNKITEMNSTIETLNSTVQTQGSKISTLESTVQTQGSDIETINSNIETLNSTVETQGSTIETLNSTVETQGSSIETLNSTVQTQGSSIETLDSSMKIVNSAFIIQNGKMTGISEILTNILNSDYVTTDLLNADVAWIENGKIKQGAIGTVEIADAAITTQKVKDLSADVIKTGTLKTECLILTTDEVDPETGEKKVALITALNAKTKAGEGDVLDGAIIKDETIEAAKIKVVDLEAFGATIGNFEIETSNIHNGKTSLTDPTNGVYIGTDGIALGQGSLLNMTDDSPFRVESDGDFHLGGKDSNYVNFDAFNGKLDINADSIKMESSSLASQSYVDQKAEGITTTVTDVNDRLTTMEQNSEGFTWSIDKTAIVSSVNEYYQSTSTTALTGGSWSENAPTWTQGTYIWIRIKNTNGKGTVTYSKPVCVTGNTGAQGAKGEKGDTGEQGPRGLQGLQGEKGDQGIQGPQGEQGIQGEKGDTGASGSTTYFHIKYSSVANPTSASQMTETPSEYIGTYVDFTPTDSSEPSKYTWSRFQGLQGPQGDQGIPGTNGSNGKTSYLHIKYSNDGGSTFTANSGETVGTYIGTCVDYNSADPTTVGSYTWAKIKGEQGAKGAKGDQGTAGKSIGSVVNYYLATASSSNVTTSTSGWTTTVQSVSSSKKYLWNYEVVKYTDGTTASTTSPCIIGAYGDTGAKGDKGTTGDTGATGNGISSITEHYQVSTSNTTTPTSWSTSVPTMTATNKYLWNYETITYTNGTTKDTAKRVIGVYGDKGATGATGPQGPTGATGADGRGISSTSVTYQAGSSGTTVPTGTWSSSIPSVSAGQYLWTKTVTNYTSGNPTTAYSVGRMGTNGTNGTNGSNGSDGKGIKSTAITYQVWSSGTSTPTGAWSTSVPSITANNPYLWTKTVITYTDNNTSTSYSVGAKGDGLDVKDTRNDNQPPSWYMTNYPKTTAMEFKYCSKIGLSGVGTYCALQTIVPWGDASGGYPKQTAKVEGTGKEYWRVGTSASAWSSWVDPYGTAVNSAKTATNYMNFANNGLTIGNMTASTLGKNVLIDSDSVDIRNGSEVLASYGEEIVLRHDGKDAFTIKQSTLISQIKSAGQYLESSNETEATNYIVGSFSNKTLTKDLTYIWHIKKNDRYAIFKPDSTIVVTELYYYSNQPAYLQVTTSSSSSYIPCAYADSDAVSELKIDGSVWIDNLSDASGKVQSIPPLGIGSPNSAHLEIDSNEITAKSDATTPSILNLNMEGGAITFNNNDARGLKYQNGILYSRYAPAMNSDAIPVYSSWYEALNIFGDSSFLNIRLGYGTYSRSQGSTQIYGNNIELMSKNDVTSNTNVILSNGKGVQGTRTNGVKVNNFQPCNTNNNCVIGYGSYESDDDTNIYGGNINFTSNHDIHISGNNLVFDNTYGLIGKNTSGQKRRNIQLVNGNNNFVLGYDSYNYGEGATNVYGDKISTTARMGIVLNTEFGGITSNRNLNALWSGAWYMQSGQTASLTEKVTDQLNGIVLVWSKYSSGAQNYEWNCFFIPKEMVSKHPGVGYALYCAGAYPSYKYVYVNNQSIGGNAANNNSNNSVMGLTIDSKNHVLRYVFGV